MTLKEMAAYLTDRNSEANYDKIRDDGSLVIHVNLDTILYFGFEKGEEVDADKLRDVIAEQIGAQCSTGDDDMRGVSATWKLDDLEPANDSGLYISECRWTGRIFICRTGEDGNLVETHATPTLTARQVAENIIANSLS